MSMLYLKQHAFRPKVCCLGLKEPVFGFAQQLYKL